MARYEWRQINHDPGYGNPFEVDGRIVGGTLKHADPNSTGFVALVEVTEDGDLPAQDDGNPVCGADTANGTCTREVDDPDETCWQH